MSKAVNNPKHYNSHKSGIECILLVENLGFCIGNAIKYLWRSDMKNGLEDLEKARWYIIRERDRAQGPMLIAGGARLLAYITERLRETAETEEEYLAAQAISNLVSYSTYQMRSRISRRGDPYGDNEKKRTENQDLAHEAIMRALTFVDELIKRAKPEKPVKKKKKAK